MKYLWWIAFFLYLLGAPSTQATAIEYPDEGGLHDEYRAATCAHFPDEYTLALSSKLKIVYLSPKPTPSMLERQDSLSDYPIGSLFGTAIVLFSDPIATTLQTDDVELSNPGGEILYVHSDGSNCSAVIDFAVPGRCDDTCMPAGVCVGIRKGAIREAAELGRSFPPKSDCKILEDDERPHCTDAKLYLANVAAVVGTTPYADASGSLLLSFTSPTHHTVPIDTHDFHVYAPEGTEVLEVIPVSHTHFNVKMRYPRTYKRIEVKVCFIGGHKLEAYGIPYVGPEAVCIEFVKVHMPVIVSPLATVYRGPDLLSPICPLAFKPHLEEFIDDEEHIKHDITNAFSGQDFSGHAEGGVWWIPKEDGSEDKVTYLSSKARSSKMSSDVKVDFYQYQSGGEVKESDQYVSLPYELRHLAADLSGGKKTKTDVLKTLPQVYGAMDLYTLVAALELLNSDATVNRYVAHKVLKHLEASKEQYEWFQDLLARHYGHLEPRDLMVGFGVADKYGNLESPTTLLKLLKLLPDDFDILALFPNDALAATHHHYDEVELKISDAHTKLHTDVHPYYADEVLNHQLMQGSTKHQGFVHEVPHYYK